MSTPCVIEGCKGTMRVVAKNEAGNTREWSCNKGAHTWIELKPGTRRCDAEATR